MMPAAQAALADAGLLKEIETQKNSSLETGEIWFLVDKHWYSKMIDYLHGNGDIPGPIDNSSILEENMKSLKPNLQDELDYVLFPERGWNMIREKFGTVPGQVPISRKVIGMGMFVKRQTVEVYPMQLNLCLYTDQNNPISITFSRTGTPNDLKKEARNRFHVGSAVQLRLYQKMENELEWVQDAKCHESLDECGFVNGQTIVIDVEENGKWNIDPLSELNENNEAAAGPSAASTPRGLSGNRSMSGDTPSLFGRGSVGFSGGSSAHVQPGLCGLTNLGNTCFMNSALQCMVNAGPLTEYFVSDKYKAEINETNPLGMHGEIAQTFGELCKQMWSGRCASVIPRAFKSTVGRFAPQFSGYQQQDSQELMAFLLDGLHEDLNRVRQKPYVEVKDADGKPDEEVANEAWSNYKKRNDSIIVDLFHGLLKSTVVCPECNKISVTFDPFCYLSLPLPAKKERQVVVNFVPLNSQKPILKVKVTVPKAGSVKDLADAVGRVVDANSSQLIVCDVYGSRAYKLFEPSASLSNVMDRDDIYVYEMDPVPQSENPVIVVLYNRIEKKSYMAPQLTLVSLPGLVLVPKNSLDYTHLKTAAENAFGRFTNFPTPDEVWWRPDNESDSGVEDNGDNGGPDQDNAMEVDQPAQAPSFFKLRVVNSQGTSTFEDITATRPPTATEHTSGEIYVAVDWHPLASRFLDVEYLHYVQEHESVNEVKINKKSLNLDECLDLFTTTEKLGEQDLWYCPQCKKHQQATKKFDLWKLPDVLIIHLKRFSYTRFWRDKIESLIDYPLRDLDLTKWVINKKYPNCVYDLIAVSNHYGGLGGGHYTAYAKNKSTNKWYSFDDSSVSQIGEESVVTKSGYVLVYARRTNAPTRIEPTTDPNVEMEDND